MSERVRNTVLASLVGSKRIIVAACAAIAMFLGAVSAGASVFVYDNPVPDSGEMSAIFNPAATTDSSKKSPSKDTSADNLSQQSTFQGERVIVNSPLNTATLSVPQSKITIKKNPVAEALRGTTNSTVFQSQADLLDKLQNKTAETVGGISAPVDIPGLKLQIPTQPPTDSVPTTTPTTPVTVPSDETPPVDNPAENSINSIPPITSPEN